ncbi:hypothetical protein Btru_043255 [Bulinus truncatus]|nr:hypothetical protein Btru_043255 [Bulinus truncatus]
MIVVTLITVYNDMIVMSLIAAYNDMIVVTLIAVYNDMIVMSLIAAYNDMTVVTLIAVYNDMIVVTLIAVYSEKIVMTLIAAYNDMIVDIAPCTPCWNDFAPCSPCWNDFAQCTPSWNDFAQCTPCWNDIAQCTPCWNESDNNLVQELLYYQSCDPVLNGSSTGDIRLVLTNSDRPCHKLCENLDHALLHGLKHVTHGYWPVVKQLSHKDVVRNIEILVNVTTDLGRGRAWLFAVLNEGLLECYIRMLGGNEKLVKKYYAKDALLLDGDRMNQLLTLASGLEVVTFKFDLDLPYLDLNAYPPRSRTDAQMDGDMLSTSPSSRLSRMNSSGSFRLSVEISSGSVESRSRLTSDSDSASITSSDAHTQVDPNLQMRLSTYSVDSGFPSEGLCNSTTTLKQRSVTPPEMYGQVKASSATPSDTLSVASLGSQGDHDRHQRLENINPADEEDENGNGTTLEVIHITKKVGVAGKTKRKKSSSSRKEAGGKSTTSGRSTFNTKSENTNGITTQHVDDTPLPATEKKDQELLENKDVCISKSGTIPEDGKPLIPQYDSGVEICNLAKCADMEATPEPPNEIVGSALAAGIQDQETNLSNGDHSCNPSQMSSIATIQNKIDSLCSFTNEINTSSQVSSQNSNSRKHSDKLAENPNGVFLDSGQKTELITGPSSQSSHSSVTDPSAKDSNHFLQTGSDHKPGSSKSLSPGVMLSSRGDDEYDLYSNYPFEKDNSDVPGLHYQMDGVSRAKAAMQSSSQLKDYMDYILKSNHPSPPGNITADREKSADRELDLSVNLDNNLKLQVMLEILSHEDEKFIKMFATRESMMEGDPGVVYLLISDQRLYVLKYKGSTRKFIMQSSALLVDLIFISTGLNEQMISIESRGKNKQKQRLWVTPGHQALTKCILACLTEAVKKANENFTSVRPRFSVGSEVPLQKIALRKYISKELNCEPSDVSINDYSLVFWEDPSAASNWPKESEHKEGTLLMWTQDPVKGHVWKPVHIALKNSMLSVANHKTDPRPHSLLGLGGDQCIGCRLISVGDRNNCVELVIARGGTWIFSAASEVEIREWRHALCSAVSQGIEDDHSLLTCVPCCAVLACGIIFLCHEDLQTKFFRTLGSAKVEDITSLRTDACDPTYCILEFESQEAGVSSVPWIFYFSSEQDLERYRLAIGQAWKEKYQRVLLMSPGGCPSPSRGQHQPPEKFAVSFAAAASTAQPQLTS